MLNRSPKEGGLSYYGKNRKPVLNKNFEFKRVYKRGKSRVCPAVVVYAMPQRFGCLRLGITASKKLGCAVERNRARRVIRAAFSPLKQNIVGSYDIVLVCRTKAVASKSQQIEAQLREALDALGLLKQ